MPAQALKCGLWVSLLIVLVDCNPSQPTAPPTALQTPTIRPSATASLTPSLAPSATLSAAASSTATPDPGPDAGRQVINAANASRVELSLTLSEHKGAVYGVAISPDSALVASGSHDETVRLWDAVSGELLHTLVRHNNRVYSVGFSRDGTLLLSGGRDRTVQIWDASSAEHLYGLRAFGEVFALAFAPDAQQFAAASLYSARGQMWPLQPGATWVALEGHTTRLRSVAYSRDGSLLATGDVGGAILLRDPQSGEPFQRLDINAGLNYDIGVYGLVFSSDGEKLIAGGDDGFIRIFDIVSGEEVLAWPAHAGGVWSIDLSAAGDVLASGGQDGALRLWDAVSGERLVTIGGHRGPVRRVVFSAYGATLASGGDDWQVRLWRIALDE